MLRETDFALGRVGWMTLASLLDDAVVEDGWARTAAELEGTETEDGP